ncbi:MAG: phosphoribosylamine--glycine ligase [Spirochaetales bacterium]|nr:phosphoribosylamine--glycine ligase [Spirochaetales bacterium]
MRVLVIGSGAREHALAWKFSKSKRNTGVFVAPGNGGTEALATNLPEVDGTDSTKVISACKRYGINLVFVGPEIPLSLGLVDDLENAGIPAVGPKKRAAALESSKVFSKQFMTTFGIPTASADFVTEISALVPTLKKYEGKRVIKMSGLAAGKGVLESADFAELEHFGLKGLESGPLVIEEFLEGYEVSVFALTDGVSYKVLPYCTDYKKAGAGNNGPNTGGMGAICPVPWVDGKLAAAIEQQIIEPTFKGFRAEEFDYRGVVYFGIMVTPMGPKLLEYNVRFGDPEAQVLIPLIDNDFCNLSEALVSKSLDRYELRTVNKTAICIVLASPGYPGKYKKDLPVSIGPGISHNQFVFHSNTYKENETIYTNGGRCFSAVGLGTEILTARASAYQLASTIMFPGAWFRHDIGNRIFGNR